MIYNNYDLLFELYFQVKLILVLIMAYTHSKFSLMFKDFELDTRNRNQIYYKMVP